MCMILSLNCCPVTIFEYSSTDVTLLPSLFVSSERTRCSQSKWQSADFDLLKPVKERKIVWTALFLGKVCIWPDKISNVTECYFRSEIYSEVESEPKHEVATAIFPFVNKRCHFRNTENFSTNFLY